MQPPVAFDAGRRSDLGNWWVFEGRAVCLADREAIHFLDIDYQVIPIVSMIIRGE